MAVKNPKMVVNAVTDAQIRTWDPVFKASLEKAKSEMPKTYRELEILMEVLDSISNHMSVGHNSKEKLESMMTVLEVQFNNYEISWENSMWEISDDVFYEFEELYLTIAEAVDKVKAALFESKKFLREKSIQRGKDRNNGRDRNNSGYRNRDTKNVQKRPRWSKKTKSVQEHPRVSKNVQERPSRAKTVVPEMYQELALLQEILDSIDRHGSVGLASLPTAALIAQLSCFEQSRQDALLELLRDIQRDVDADYALFDKVHDLQLTTKEAVDQALLKSEKFRRAQAAQAAKAASEAHTFTLEA